MPETILGGYTTGNAYHRADAILQDGLRSSQPKTVVEVHDRQGPDVRDSKMRPLAWLDFCVTRLAEKPEVNSRFIYFLQSLTGMICVLILVCCFSFGHSKSYLYAEMVGIISIYAGVGAGSRYVLKKARTAAENPASNQK